jgi:hypothetical protein
VVGFNSDRFIKYCNKASPDYDSTSHIVMNLPENYFRQKKYGLVMTYVLRPWSYFPSTMDLQFASRKRL